MIEEMDVRMMDQQAGKGAVGGHVGVAGGQGRRTPVKAELRQKIQSRRRAQGQDDLSQEGLFKEPEKHELTPEEMERKERRRLQNRMAARRCREKKKKQQMYTKEEFQQVSDERDRFKKLTMEMMDLMKKHRIPIPIPMKQEADEVSDRPCAASTFMPLPVKTEPGLEGQSCHQQGAQPPQSNTCHGSELRALLSPPTDGLVSMGDFPPEQIFGSDLLLPTLEPYRYASDPLTTPGGSPEGAVWGRGLPSTSDSEYAAATPQSCISSVEGASCPSPDLPCTQGSMGFDLHAGLSSPDGTGLGMSGGHDMSFYPATPDVPQNDCSMPERDELAVMTLEFLKGMVNGEEDDVFYGDDGNVSTDLPFSDWRNGL